MSTFPANSDDRLGQVAQSFRSAKDEGLLSVLSSVPDLPFADATSHPVDRKSDDQAQPATTSPLEMTGDGDVKRSQTTVRVPPTERQIPRPPRGDKLPGLIPAGVVPSRGYVDLGMPTPMLRRRRPGYAWAGVKKLLVTSAITATVAGSLVVEILDMVEDSDLPALPEFTSRAPPLPQAAPPPTEFGAIMTGSKAERITPAASLRPTVSSQPTAQSENQPTDSRIEVTLPQMVAGSEYKKIIGNAAATPEPHSIAIPKSTPISRPEPPAIAAPELTSIARLEPMPTTPPEPHSIAIPESTSISRPSRPRSRHRSYDSDCETGTDADHAAGAAIDCDTGVNSDFETRAARDRGTGADSNCETRADAGDHLRSIRFRRTSKRLS